MNVPNLVLLPGFDGTGDLFEPFIAALPSGFASTVIRYGPTVTSYSQCEEAAREHLPTAEPYILVGESFSGPVAISIAAAQPPGLCGLVLVGSFVSSPSRMLTWLSPLIRLMPTHGGHGWLTDFLLLGRFATPDIRNRIANAMAQISPAIVRKRLREIALLVPSDRLTRISVPVLYLQATFDRLVPSRCGHEITRMLPRARIVTVEAPHLMLQCAPQDCSTAICDFAQEAYTW